MATDTRPPMDLERRAAEKLPPGLRGRVEAVDRALTGFFSAYGITLLRLALGVVFIWFGALKVAGRSPVEDLVTDTLEFLPRDVALYGLGAWEIVIGLGLIIPVALRLTLLLFWAQLLGTLSALFIESDRAFQDGNPLLLTTEGEFIVKNLVLLSAGIVVGATVRRRERARPAAGGDPPQ